MIPWMFLIACGEPAPTQRTVTEGTVCIDAGITTATMEFDACLSSSCDTLISAACEAALAGTTVTIAGEATIESTGGECTADCGLVSAECAMPALPDTGDVTVAVGSGAAAPLEDFVGCP